MSSFDPPPSPERLFNPYAAPDAPIGGEIIHEVSELEFAEGEAERIRRKYLKHEAVVKSIGSLHISTLFGGGGCLFSMIGDGEFTSGARLRAFTFAVVLVLTIILNVSIGIGLFRLRKWARWTDIALSGIVVVLLSADAVRRVATAIKRWPLLIIHGAILSVAAYVLIQLLSSRSAFVFSEHYRAIIAQTPKMRQQPSLRKYRPSIVVKCFVGLLLLVLLLIVFVGIMAALDGD